MHAPRRAWLKKVVRPAITALAAAAAVTAGHVLLRKPSGRYPARRGKYQSRGTRLIRPPGAVEERAFLAGCIRCCRCQDACEPGAIRFFTEAQGEHYHTPYVDPSIRACTLCMKCTQVCPTGVLRPMETDQKAEVAMGTVELETDRCLSYKAKARYEIRALTPWKRPTLSLEPDKPPAGPEEPLERRGPCGECFMFCPVRRRAIKLEPGQFLAPLVFPEACVGCGLCEEICRQMVRGEPAIRVVATRGKVR